MATLPSFSTNPSAPLPSSALVSGDNRDAMDKHGAKVQEKLGEYAVMVAPIERALRELQLAREMLRARTEDEINETSPALAALGELLSVSSLDLLLAPDRHRFLQDALTRSGVSLDEARRCVVEAEGEAGEQMQALGLPEAA
jgi:hypothetical protein